MYRGGERGKNRDRKDRNLIYLFDRPGPHPSQSQSAWQRGENR